MNELLVAEKNDYTLTIFDDSEGLENPRELGDKFGEMACFSSRHFLGDKQSQTDPEDFMRALLFSSFCAKPKVVYDFIKAGGSKYACIKYNVSTRETELYERSGVPGSDEPVESCPLREPPVVTYPASLNRSNEVPDWFLDSCLELLTIREMIKLVELSDELLMLPLYIYDHSGITMNTTGFACQWDTSMVGWIYVEKENVLKYFDVKHLTPAVVRQAKAVLVSEVAEYDLYLRGSSFGFTLTKDGEEVDSCYGFLCEYTDLPKEIEFHMPDELKGITANLNVPAFFA